MCEQFDNEHDRSAGAKCEEKSLEESCRSGLGPPLLGHGWGLGSVGWVSG